MDDRKMECIVVMLQLSSDFFSLMDTRDVISFVVSFFSLCTVSLCNCVMCIFCILYVYLYFFVCVSCFLRVLDDFLSNKNKSICYDIYSTRQHFSGRKSANMLSLLGKAVFPTTVRHADDSIYPILRCPVVV